ncbi:MAG: hypothetical protein LBO65_05650 [Spirochaetaceae bacterium]|jgi:hypothetical protein|nr:hypothetical protein [Spirochaetaceae bacterium]
MFKKRLIIGSVLLALLVLFALTGCSSPAGADGAQGPRGPERVDGTITPEQLAELFTIHDQIRVVTAGTAQIAGIVPAGKTLEISGPAIVLNNRSLTINGTVHIFEEGTLTATGTGNGTINRGSTGLLIVDGTLAADLTFFDNGVPSYVRVNPTAVIKVTGTAGTPAAVNALFAWEIPAVETTDTTILDSQILPVLTAWTGTKTLITTHNFDFASGTVDVSKKGQLVIAGSLTLGDATGSTGATLKASDDGNVTVTGGIDLEYGTSSLVGGITITGGLAIADMTVLPAPGPGDPPRLPTTVNLEKATVTNSGTTASKLVLPPAAVEIDEIVLGYGIEISQATALTVGTISNTGASGAGVTLTIPGITVKAALIDIDGGQDLSIAGATGAILSPDSITGNNSLRFTDNLVKLSGPIELDTTIFLNGLENLGATEGIYDQLALISGDGLVNAAALTLDFTSHEYNIAITTTGSATFKGDTTFNGTLSVGNVLASEATPVSITLNDTGNNFNELKHTSQQVLTIKGTGDLTLDTGVLEANEIVFDGKEVVLLGTVTNKFGGKLTVGSNAAVTLNSASTTLGKFVFGPGVYTPGSGGIEFAAATNKAVITLPTLDGSLVLGELSTGNLTLKNDAAAQSYTATGLVTLSGEDNGAIVVEPGSDLAPSKDVNIILGNGAIVLAGANSTLASSATDGYKISGFTAHRGEGAHLTVQSAINDQTSFVGRRAGNSYTSGIMINATDSPTYEAVFTEHVFTEGVLTTGAGTSKIFTAAGAGGGIITKDSDIIE